MRVEPPFYLPVGFIGRVKRDNTHGVPEHTKFIITGYEHDGCYHYKVQFKGAKWNELNHDGPFISHNEIELGQNSELFYEKSKV